MPFPLLGGRRPLAGDETLARVSQPDGNRSYEQEDDYASAPLCDSNGRLIVRIADAGGFAGASPDSPGFTFGQQVETGSAPQKGNLGAVNIAKVMERAQFYDPLATGATPYCRRFFGTCQVAGWIQLLLKNENAGVNPPVLGDIPEVTIPIGVDQNFLFGEYLIMNGAGVSQQLATYFALSSTRFTYTPIVGNDVWFYFLGFL